MTIRSRSYPWLVVAALAAGPSSAVGQDTPLYRDPNPSDGPRINGPLLPTMPPTPNPVPPPSSSLGAFQPADPGPAPEIPREPLLIVAPIPPPNPATLLPMLPAGEVEFRRKTTIRAPGGPIGQCHERFHTALFGPRKPTLTTMPASAKHGFLWWCFHPNSAEGEAPSRPFSLPPWPSWPLQDGH